MTESLPNQCREIETRINEGRGLTISQERHKTNCNLCLLHADTVKTVRVDRLTHIAQLQQAACLMALAVDVGGLIHFPGQDHTAKAVAHRESCRKCVEFHELSRLAKFSRAEQRSFYNVARLLVELRAVGTDCQGAVDLTRSDDFDEARMPDLEEHVARCDTCQVYMVLTERPINEGQKEALETFVAIERITRASCPDLDDLKPIELDHDGVSDHLGWCKPCQDERRRLLAGEEVTREPPPAEDENDE